MIERTLTNAVTAAAGTQDAEDKWLGALTPDGPLKDKFDACRELAVAGSKKSVPVLAGLLDNAELSHMARYALETIPDPSVDEALREAAGKLEGDLLAGVIGSIGVRRDAGAVDLLAKHLDSGNGTVARAAARALGNIGTVPAAKAIGGAIRGTAPGNRLDFAEGLYRCAEALEADGWPDEALMIYDAIMGGWDDAPHQVRTAALRGAVLLRGENGIPLLIKAVRDDDYVMAAAAARTAQEMEGGAVSAAIAAELDSLPADRQILMMQTLGKRGGAEGIPALKSAAMAGGSAVRAEAIHTLAELGDVSSLPMLRMLQNDPDEAVAGAAKTALSALS